MDIKKHFREITFFVETLRKKKHWTTSVIWSLPLCDETVPVNAHIWETCNISRLFYLNQGFLVDTKKGQLVHIFKTGWGWSSRKVKNWILFHLKIMSKFILNKLVEIQLLLAHLINHNHLSTVVKHQLAFCKSVLYFNSTQYFLVVWIENSYFVYKYIYVTKFSLVMSHLK